MVRDCRKLAEDLRVLLERGDIGIVASELVGVAVPAAVIGNALELPPRRREVADVYARELEIRLAALDEAVREALLLAA